MEIGVAGQNAEEHDAVGLHLNDLRDPGIGIVVADEDERPLLDDGTG